MRLSGALPGVPTVTISSPGPPGRSRSERGGSRALHDEFGGGIDGDLRVAAVFLIGFFLAVVLGALRINSQALSGGVGSGHLSGGQGRGGGDDVDLGCEHLVIGGLPGDHDVLS